MFFPFSVSLWAICLPPLQQCVICAKWGFKDLFTVKIQKLPVPRIIHQECEECPELCGPRLLSRLNNENGAMPKPGSRNSLMKIFACLSFRRWPIAPDRQSWVTLSRCNMMITAPGLGEKSDPAFVSWPLSLASQPQPSTGQGVFYNLAIFLLSELWWLVFFHLSSKQLVSYFVKRLDIWAWKGANWTLLMYYYLKKERKQ